MFFSLLTTGLLALSTSVNGAPTLARRADVCNGRAELCTRSYGAVSYLTAHDSFGVSSNPLALGRNQAVSVSDQLNKFGVRALQAQSHMKDGVLHFCHTSCALFDGGPVVDFFNTVKKFMDENPSEVITMILTNPEGVSVKDVWQPLFKESGLEPLAFTPPSQPVKAADWPTLGTLIDDKKNLVVFMDADADINAVPYIMPQFDNVWEPPFSEVDPTFPCRVDRNSGPISAADKMFMINHNLNKPIVSLRREIEDRGLFDDIKGAFDTVVDKVTETADKVGGKVDEGKAAVNNILIPDFQNAATTNGVPSIVANSDECSAFANGRASSFVLLDFVDVGEGKKAVDQLNGF